MKPSASKIKLPRRESIVQGNLTWTDFTFPGQKEKEYLAEKYRFHPVSLDDSLSRSQISKLDDFDSYLLIVFHFPVTSQDGEVIKSNWLAAFIGADYVITLHDELAALTDLFKECREHEERRREFFAHGSGYLFYRITDHLIKYCLVILDKVLTRMDDIEDSVFDESGDDTQAISVLRRDIITMRRTIWPSRAIINDLKIRVQRFTDKDLEIYFDSLLDQVNRIWDNLEESKEVIEVFKDSDFVLVTNRINRIVQTLTILSSIFLPFLVVSSIYGMNVALPGGIERGSPESFGILLGIMIILSGGMLYFFHRRRWI